ncbi:MAG: hypothetical protein JRH20_02190 [Deltaproteobacteria bacterium]|nr:hypothetical protein [Deltaproteobacteria bacterium]
MIRSRSWLVTIIFTLFALCFASSHRPAEAKGNAIAVFDLQLRRLRLSASVRGALSDYLAAQLAARGLSIVPRSQLKKRLRRKRRASYRLCYDQSCQIEIGRELAAQKSVSSQVMRIGKRCVVTLTLYDLRTATSERAATAHGRCNESGIMNALTSAAVQLVPLKKTPPSTGRTGVRLVETGKKRQRIAADFDAKRFRPLAFYPRALKLARSLEPDAVLIDFDVEGVYPAGHADLTLQSDYRANYAFRSPRQSRRDPKLPANVKRDRVCLVYVEVSAKHIEVYPAESTNDCKEKPRGPWRCSLASAFALARTQGAPTGNVVAKVSWLWDGWFFDFGAKSMSVKDSCR